MSQSNFETKLKSSKTLFLFFEDKFYQIFEEDVVKGNVAVIRKSGDGEFEDMEMNMHFVNKKIKYVWDANLQVSINLKINKGLFASYYLFCCLLTRYAS